MNRFKFLEKFVKEQNICTALELGTGMGYSSAQAMIDGGAKVVVTIDIANPGIRPTSDKILFYHGDILLLDDMIHEQYPERFDMIFMDANHDYKSVSLYWKLYKDLAKRFIVFHDRDEIGTEQFLHQLESENYKIAHYHEPPYNLPRIAVVRMPDEN